MARLKIGQNRAADASEVLASACGKFTEGFETSDMKRARAVMAELSSA